ncbi:MAG: DNA repair protein RadC [Desulfobacterales bacterium]|nr:DNA repair protein RadC [Desulfobacterales bacterium]
MEQVKPHKGEGHRQRLREQFLEFGLSGFKDYEVVELLLTLATPRKDCKDIAKEVLDKFKNLPAIFEASMAELCEIKGIGSTNVFGLKLVKSVCERYLEKKIEQTDPIINSKVLLDFLNLSIRDKAQECFNVIFLNAKNRVISQKILFTGSLTSSFVHPREVVREALDHKSAALILAHNHPSGDPAPSKEDIAITRQIVFACKLMDIIVHEHMVIGNNHYFSFADYGYIRQFNQEYEQIVLKVTT